jgi:hypothetical protein
MKNNLKKLVLPLFFILGGVAGFFGARQLPVKATYTPAVKWMVEHPEYSQKVYEAYYTHVQAAEAVLMEELGTLSGKNE